MTNMAAMPIYIVKTLKYSSPEPKADDLDLVCNIGCSSATKFVQMMTLGWPRHILRQGQILSLILLYGKKGKTMDISETVVVYDVKVGRCS